MDKNQLGRVRLVVQQAEGLLAPIIVAGRHAPHALRPAPRAGSRSCRTGRRAGGAAAEERRRRRGRRGPEMMAGRQRAERKRDGGGGELERERKGGGEGRRATG